MEYRIRKICEECGLDHYQVVPKLSRVRKTCSEKCSRRLAGRNCQPQPDPTPEEIAEMCWQIRSGRLRLTREQVFEDFENKPRRNIATTFVRVKHGA